MTILAKNTIFEKTPAKLRGFLTGNRIPKDYFEITGTGESDIAIHAGSYHLALKSAGIEMCNVVTYSSILPGIAEKIEKPKFIQHGSVMESIMSVCHARKGELATAGIIYGWLYDKKELERRLKASIEELYWNGFSDHYSLGETHILSESFIPRKNYGTALAALCFTSYFYPVLESQV